MYTSISLNNKNTYVDANLDAPDNAISRNDKLIKNKYHE